MLGSPGTSLPVDTTADDDSAPVEASMKADNGSDHLKQMPEPLPEDGDATAAPTEAIPPPAEAVSLPADKQPPPAPIAT